MSDDGIAVRLKGESSSLRFRFILKSLQINYIMSGTCFKIVQGLGIMKGHMKEIRLATRIRWRYKGLIILFFTVLYV